MPDHAALIAELEAASEGSRELSDLCLIAVGWVKKKERDSFGTPCTVWYMPDGNYGPVPLALPALSLDDAIKWMVPESAINERLMSYGGHGVEGWPDKVWNFSFHDQAQTIPEDDHKTPPNRRWKSFGESGATAPLAVCIAALKAHQGEDFWKATTSPDIEKTIEFIQTEQNIQARATIAKLTAEIASLKAQAHD